MNAWLNAPVHAVYARMRCVWGLSVCMWCVLRAIWSALPCRGPCEVLSAWPLWSPVATGGLLHSTSSPGSRPQKRKFGSPKWRGCSRAIYRALYRSSATHDIPYENQCVCGACGMVCVSVGGKVGEGWWGKEKGVVGFLCAYVHSFMRKCIKELMSAGMCDVSWHTNACTFNHY